MCIVRRMPININVVRRAIHDDEMVPCFQPIVELQTGLLTGFEVLARWKHLKAGFVLPENFISLAEKHGLAGELMQQVMRKALVAAAPLPKTLGLSVNVSSMQLRDLTLAQTIRGAADGTGFPMNRLTLEITESAFVDNLERAQAIASELKTMGCRLSLDDFGTGSSSLRHLPVMPFDELKIDRTFVASMTHNLPSRKIVAAIVGLGLSLGLVAQAEGIETSEQAEILLRLRCERGQGWLYGRPLPAEELRRVVEDAPHKYSMIASKCDASAFVSLEAQRKQHRMQWRAIYDTSPPEVATPIRSSDS
jgi:EAL domain-containing protein (putative c-di-GMP-specific phosphodiesterase class I)